MMNKSTKRLFVLTIMLFVVIFVVGVSYAYTHANFFNVENSTTIAVNGGKMEIIYNDPSGGGYSSSITAEGVIPGWETTKLFTVTGTNEIDSNQTVDTNMYYKVGLVVEENTFSDGALKYEITSDNGEVTPTGQVLNKLTGNVPRTGTEWFGMGYFVPSADSVVHKYALKISFPETGENQNIDKGKHFAGYVTITDEGERVNLNVIVDSDNPASNYNKTLLKNSGIFLETPVKEGYAFMGWNVVSGNATVEGNKLIVYEEQNIQIKATWESDIKLVTLILDLDGGKTSDSLNQSLNSYSLVDLKVPTKEDHIFLGWELVQGTADINGNYIQLKDSSVVLKAKWRLGFKDFEFIAVTTDNSSPYHEFIVPQNGTYMIELWGAQGGMARTLKGGAGAYVKGEIFLTKNQKLYFYIGEYVNKNTTNNPGYGAYNGGGKGNFVCYDHNSGKSWTNINGGGATDVRISDGAWNNSQGLASRIMVAGGGGGSDDNYYNGASAGGLTGYNGSGNKGSSYIGTAATQVSAGSTGGSFGIGGAATWGGNNCNSNTGSGGGGGYYGGGGSRNGANSGNIATGGSGSSYISGHTGCVAINSATNITPKSGCTTGTTDNSCSVHYSGMYFNNTVMIDGSGYSWTNVKGVYTGMPSPIDGTIVTGNQGHGHARITYIGE